jgi:hypothetical protein
MPFSVVFPTENNGFLRKMKTKEKRVRQGKNSLIVKLSCFVCVVGCVENVLFLSSMQSGEKVFFCDSVFFWKEQFFLSGFLREKLQLELQLFIHFYIFIPIYSIQLSL